MKTKIIAFLLGIIVCGLISCSRNNGTSIHSNNYWTLAGNTFNVTNCTAPAENIEATDYSATNTVSYGTLLFSFSQNTNSGSRTYRVVDDPHYTFGTADNVVTISAVSKAGSPSQTAYKSVYSNGSMVTVTISTSGKVTAVGSGIAMVNEHNASDIQNIDFNLIQTQ